MSSGFNSICDVGGTNQIVILQAIVDRIRSEINDSFGSEATCFISDVPWPAIEIHDTIICTVSPSSAQFVQEEPTGAGPAGVVELASFQVSVWSKIQLDQMERSVLALTDPDRGILVLKRRVLKALAGQQLYSTDGQPLLISYLRPISATHPAAGKAQDEFASFSIAFQGSYYWDLSDQ